VQGPREPRSTRVKIEGGCPTGSNHTMDYAQMSDKLFSLEYQLKQAERKLHGYVKKAAWSEDDCFQVDILYKTMEKYETEIGEIRTLIELHNEY